MDKNKVIEAAAKLVQKGAYDKAIKEYQKVLDADPKDVRVLQKMGELYQKKNENNLAATFFSRVAETYAGDGFFLKAVALYKQVLKLSPGLVEVNLKLAELHQQLGLISEAMAYFQIVANHYDKVGDTKSSLDTLKRMVDLDPENVASRIKLAELYARENIKEPAVEEFRRAAEYLKRHNRTDDYLRVAERITALVPEDVALARELAAAYLQRGDQKRALAKLQLCFKADPRDLETLNLLAEAFAGLGQTSKTLSVYKELAKIYGESNQNELASGVWTKIAGLDPQDPDLLARRGPVASAPPARAAEPPAPRAAPAAPARAAPQPQAAPPPAAPASAQKESLAKLLTETDVYVKYGLHDKALEHLRRIFGVDPENLEAHEKAYQIYVSAQHTREASEQLLNVLRLMTRRSEVDRAQPYLRAILAENPDHPEVSTFLAVLQKPGEDLSASEPLADEAILVDTGDEEVIVADAPDDALVAEPEDLALVGQGDEEVVDDDAVVLSAEEAVEEEVFETSGYADDKTAFDAVSDAQDEEVLSGEVVPELEDDEPLGSTQPNVRPPAAVITAPLPTARAAAPSSPPSRVEPPAAKKPAAPVLPPEPVTSTTGIGRAPPSRVDTVPEMRAVPPPPPAARKPAAIAPPPPPPAPEPEASDDSVAQEIEEAGFLLDQGLTDEARDILETILLVHPGHAEATALLARLEGSVSTELTNPSIALETEQHLDEAQERDAFDLAAELADEMATEDPVAIESGGDDFQYSVEEVFQEFKKGLEKVVKPEDVDTHYDLGIAYKEMGLIDDAIQEFNVAREGCKKKKREVDCLTMMGMLQMMKGDSAAAVSSYQQALATEFATGETAKALEFELGTAWEANGNNEKALLHLQRVASQDPQYRGVGEMVTKLKAAAPKTRKVGYL